MGYSSNGGFGYGGHGQYGAGSGHYGGAGGGSGWYGGSGGLTNDSGKGGSSYISGHPGCVAIANASSETASSKGEVNSVERSTHYSGKKFSNTKIIDGNGYLWTTERADITPMPNPSGGYYASGTGRSGHGYCRISGTSVVP